MPFSNEVKQSIYIVQNGICKRKGCHNEIHSIHHKLHNTNWNRKNFPLFINSPMNGVGLCYNCHKNFSHEFRIEEGEAEIYEKWLKILKIGEVKE